MFLISARGPNTLTATSHGQKEQHRQGSQIYVQKWILREKQNIIPVQLFPNFLVCDPILGSMKEMKIVFHRKKKTEL